MRSSILTPHECRVCAANTTEKRLGAWEESPEDSFGSFASFHASCTRPVPSEARERAAATAVVAALVSRRRRSILGYLLAAALASEFLEKRRSKLSGRGRFERSSALSWR